MRILPLGAESTSPAPTPGRVRARRLSVIAHRGASGYRPEHTLASYQLAIEQGADVIEPDLVSTKDGVLVARHENEISGTTDVADHPELADRRTTKWIDGVEVTGWFTEDLTLAELRTLRAVERLPELRPGNTLYDGRFQVPTFDEILDLARSESRRRRRRIAVAPETKHPTYFASLGLDLTAPLLTSLRRIGWDRPDAPVVVQSFETTNLRELAAISSVPLMQLTEPHGAPHDLLVAGDATTYADLLTPAGLRGISRYACWVGAAKDSILPRDGSGRLTVPTRLVDDAHRAGLLVGVYTIRDENAFLPTELRRGEHPGSRGDAGAELAAFVRTGVDGVFVDFPDSGVAVREALAPARRTRALRRYASVA